TAESRPGPKSKPRHVSQKEAASFRRKFLAALTRHKQWTVGDALDFQRDLQMYEELIARTAKSRRRKPYEAANHPFVDRCAFLLDSSFLEEARLAASRVLAQLESLSETVTASVLRTSSRGERILRRKPFQCQYASVEATAEILRLSSSDSLRRHD